MITINDVIYKILSKANIKEKYIFIHCNLIPFHKYNYSNISEIWKTVNFFFKKKKILMPAFSWLNDKKKVWHFKNTKSNAGALSEFFRKNISSFRTFHPIHSVASNNMFKNNFKSESSFGSNSIWHWMCNNPEVANLSIGSKFDGGATFSHYAEEKLNVNYREFVQINGIFTYKNIKKKKFQYFARKKNIKNNYIQCQIDLKRNNIYKEIKYENIESFYLNINKASKFIIKKLKQNKNYLIS